MSIRVHLLVSRLICCFCVLAGLCAALAILERYDRKYSPFALLGFAMSVPVYAACDAVFRRFVPARCPDCGGPAYHARQWWGAEKEWHRYTCTKCGGAAEAWFKDTRD